MQVSKPALSHLTRAVAVLDPRLDSPARQLRSRAGERAAANHADSAPALLAPRPSPKLYQAAPAPSLARGPGTVSGTQRKKNPWLKAIPAGLRGVPALASLPVVFATLTFFPRVGPWGFVRLCRSLRAGTRVRYAASRPCARPRFRPCALAPSALPAGGVGVPSRPCRPLPAGASAAPAAVGWAAPVGRRVALGVCCGFFAGFVSVSGRFPWSLGAVCAVVASSRRFRAGVRCVALAGAGVSAVVFRCCGRGGFRLCCVGVGVCCGLVGLGGVSVGGSPVPWCSWAGVWRVGSRRRSSGAPAGLSGFVAPSARLGGLAVSLVPLPVLVARVAGCRCRWRREQAEERAARLSRQQAPKTRTARRQARANRQRDRPAATHRTHRTETRTQRQAPTPRKGEPRRSGERRKPHNRDKPRQRTAGTTKRKPKSRARPGRNPATGRTQRHGNHRNETRNTRQSNHSTPPKANPATDGSRPPHRRRSGGRPAGSGPQGSRDSPNLTPPAEGPRGRAR